MITVEGRPEGAVFAVRAKPGASRRHAGGEYHGALKVRTTRSPEKGKANDDIEKILAAALGLRRSQVTIVNGEKGRDKRILVTRVAPEELEKKLHALED